MSVGLVWFVDRHWLWMNPTCPTSMWAWKISPYVCKCGPRVDDWSRLSPPWSSSIRWNRILFSYHHTKDPLILLETSCWVLDFCWIHCLNFSLRCFRGLFCHFCFSRWCLWPSPLWWMDCWFSFIWMVGKPLINPRGCQTMQQRPGGLGFWKPCCGLPKRWGGTIAARCRLEILSLVVLPRRLKQSKEVMWHGRSGDLRVACVLGGITYGRCKFGL